jgi:hypothetical protein
MADGVPLGRLTAHMTNTRNSADRRDRVLGEARTVLFSSWIARPISLRSAAGHPGARRRCVIHLLDAMGNAPAHGASRRRGSVAALQTLHRREAGVCLPRRALERLPERRAGLLRTRVRTTRPVRDPENGSCSSASIPDRASAPMLFQSAYWSDYL